jgi:hypothetical protein
MADPSTHQEQVLAELLKLHKEIDEIQKKTTSIEGELKGAIAEATSQEIKSLVIVVSILVVWAVVAVIVFWLLCKTNEAGHTSVQELIIRCVTILGVFASATFVSVAALRRDW